jgi:hypothetical protein
MLQSGSGEDHLLPNIIIALVLELEKRHKENVEFLCTEYYAFGSSAGENSSEMSSSFFFIHKTLRCVC